MSKTRKKPLPEIVSEAEWRAAHDKLLIKEKEQTRALDALAAERRRLPMVRIDKAYVFDGPEGKVSLLDLFEGRRQLLVYHFMFGHSREVGCPGCSMFVDQVGHPAHLALSWERAVMTRLLYRLPAGASHSTLPVSRE